MERKRRRIPLLVTAAVVCVAAVLWLRPRSMEELVGVPPEEVERAVLEKGLTDEEIDVSGGLEELYGFSFSRPALCGSLVYQGASYDLSLAVGDRW